MERRKMRKDAERIIADAIAAVLPDAAVQKALQGRQFGKGRVVLVSVGKAAWQMAKACDAILPDVIDAGIVITKYDHSRGAIADYQIFEAGHPVPDENSFRATEAAIKLVQPLGENDTVIFLLSGGGSALFEKPLIEPEVLSRLTKELLNSGADIIQMNTIRKRFSAVKGGRFALCCAPAKVVAVVLSDIIGDPLDMIASGPAYPDLTTTGQAKEIVRRLGLTMSEQMWQLLESETPKELSNVETIVTGSVKNLVRAAAESARLLGYRPVVLTDCLACEAREAGSFLASIARSHQDTKESLAFIVGGETVVHVHGKGKGGRNQELALAAGIGIAGLRQTAVFSVGSDGTDGSTDAAGGYVDGEMLAVKDVAKADGTYEIADKSSVDIAVEALDDNDAYSFLRKTGGLIMTEPTGTNVNDVSVVLIKR